MSEYDFILNNIRWSFSSVSSYETCPAGFKMTYIDIEDREKNFFSDYGLLVHHVLEQFFLKRLRQDELVEYYYSNYANFVTSRCPPYPAGMEESYYQSGIDFFTDFDFDLDNYDIVSIEEEITSNYNEVSVIVKPDLILFNKKTKEYELIDFKTARIKKSKKDYEKQIETYMNQFNLYTYFYWIEKKIEIKKIKIWFIRDNKEVVQNVDPLKLMDTLFWFLDVIEKIKKDQEWNPNLDQSNKYFCNNLCGVRSVCPYII